TCLMTAARSMPREQARALTELFFFSSPLGRSVIPGGPLRIMATGQLSSLAFLLLTPLRTAFASLLTPFCTTFASLLTPLRASRASILAPLVPSGAPPPTVLGTPCAPFLPPLCAGSLLLRSAGLTGSLLVGGAGLLGLSFRGH